MMTEERLIGLYDRYANDMYRLALSYLKNAADAEDVVQAVFTKLIEGRAQPMPGKERALLTRMTANQCRDVLRASRRRKEEPLDEEIPFSEESDRQVYSAVMALPEKYRVAVYLHYYAGFILPEIASILHITPSAVSMRLHRAKKLLKPQLEVDFYE